MSQRAQELEGTWEEILARAPDLAGHRLRVTILDSPQATPTTVPSPEERLSTAGSLIAFAGSWVGDDIEVRLNEVYQARR